MTDPYEDLPEALYAQWERRWGSVAFLGVMIMCVIVGVGAIVMYEATSTAPYALGITGALCGILAGVSMLTVAALRPRAADVSGVVGGGGTFTLTAARQWAAAGWLWLAMLGLGLLFLGIGLNYASRADTTNGRTDLVIGSFNTNWWMVMSAFALAVTPFISLRYLGAFRISIDDDGMQMELGRAYRGYLRWCDVQIVQRAARGQYAIDIILKPDARVENTSPGSPLFRLAPGIITDDSPFQPSYVHLECGGWAGTESTLIEEIVHHARATTTEACTHDNP